ncbi:putative peptidoglycan lipid II flippase [Stella humosa]|uniref:Probable lipid II flippase MurJ n=1 Tax=Stella humosa TaxID=94 RepID=A0A3N1LI88_9PROT|nr:murein biosynthesis integral membrane protein MurJ [Stella humosa]ROP90990.1 putative peptidoglycan lipid II flippase [Stella humosa]BBK34660.1 putative lipid II flippase MurJ [Stella humosa]
MALLQRVATVGGYTAVSRVLGFAREVLTAAFLGAGPVADAFVVALRLPNLFRALFAEGAFSAAFVPLFAGRAAQRGRAEARVFAEDALAFLLVVLLALVVAAELAMPWVVRAIAPGFADEPLRFALAVDLTRITFPYLAFISLVALYGGVLNALDRFAAQASAPILLNLSLIVALMLFADRFPTPGHALAWGVAVAGVLQFLWLAMAAARAGIPLGLPWPRLTPDTRRLLRLMGPGVIGAGITQINLLVSTMLASLLPAGAIAHLYYADRLNQLPLGIVGIAVATAVLPQLARELRSATPETAHKTHGQGMAMALVVTLPAAMALAVLAHPIVRTLYERGAFGPEDTAATSAALIAYACGLPAFVLSRVVVVGFFAREDTSTPVRIAAMSFLVNAGLTLALMAPLGHVGVALATTVAGWLSLAVMLAILGRRGHFRPDRAMLARLPRILAAVAVMAGLLWAADWLIGGWLAAAGPVGRFAGLGGLVAIGIAGYGAAALALGAAHPSELRGMLRRRRA